MTFLRHSSHLSVGNAEFLTTGITESPDFPSPGILFRDLARNTASPIAMDMVVSALCAPFTGRHARRKPVVVAGLESRGYIWGAAIAMMLGVGFVPIKKPGKTPPGTYDEESYTTEYSSATLLLQHGLIAPGDSGYTDLLRGAG